jgi:hypothetical protein
VPFESRDPEVSDSGPVVISSSSGSLREAAVISGAGRFGTVRSLLALVVPSVGSRVPSLPVREAASPCIFLPGLKSSVSDFESLRQSLGSLRNGRISWRRVATSRGSGRSISRVRRFEIRSAANCFSRDSFFELVPGRAWASRNVEQRCGRRPLRGRSVASGAGIVCGLLAAAVSSVGSRGRGSGTGRWFSGRLPGMASASRNGRPGYGRRLRGTASGACELPVKTAGGLRASAVPKNQQPGRPTPQLQRTLELSSAVEACGGAWLRATAVAFDRRR